MKDETMNSTAINWAFNILQNLGYVIQNPTPEVVLQTPWSCVYRFDTNQGHCYLKQVPPGLSLEPQVINLLRENCAASVPLLIADNPHAHCFLMHDAGISLREYFKKNFDANLLITVIHDYIAVQRKSIPYLNRLLNLGASDWKVTNIPACYTRLISNRELLIADGLTDAEITQLLALTPKLVMLCEQLSQYPLPDTFSHNDFHDNNLLVDPNTQKITMVDLGEVAITHPFFSLLNILHHVKERCELPDDICQQLQQQALQPWLDYASPDQLLKVVSLIQQCSSVHRVLTEYRLLTGVEAQSAQQLLGRGRFFKNLRVWLAHDD